MGQSPLLGWPDGLAAVCKANCNVKSEKAAVARKPTLALVSAPESITRSSVSDAVQVGVGADKDLAVGDGGRR